MANAGLDRWAINGPFVIIGAGGHGRELLDLVEAAGCRDLFIGFVDDSPSQDSIDRVTRRGAEILGGLSWVREHRADWALGIGSSAVRRTIVAQLAGAEGAPVTLVHPSCVIGSEVTLGPGVVLCAATTVTTNVQIGQHTHVNVGSAVQHDSRIGEFTTLSPGVMVNGDVHIGNDAFFGSGAIVTRSCIINDHATVGAGAVVLDNVRSHSTVFGTPARERHRE